MCYGNGLFLGWSVARFHIHRYGSFAGSEPVGVGDFNLYRESFLHLYCAVFESNFTIYGIEGSKNIPLTNLLVLNLDESKSAVKVSSLLLYVLIVSYMIPTLQK